MNRNNEVFATIPQLDNVQRSKFSRNSSTHTAFQSGVLVPFFIDEVLPGDTFDLKLSASVRMSTPITPVMDDCYLDTYFFYVPNRLCWNRWKEFCGENHRSNWRSSFDEIDIKIPMMAFHEESTQPLNENGLFQSNPDRVQHMSTLNGTLVDYFGLPYLNFKDNRGNTTAPDEWHKTNCVSLLPFEAYNLIWNNFFRDKNYSDECPLLLQDTSPDDFEALNGHIYYTTDQHKRYFPDNESSFNTKSYLSLKPVAKFHDYFTSMLPNAQRGAPVVLPGFDEDIPVAPDEKTHYLKSDSLKFRPVGWSSDSLSGILKTTEDGSVSLQSGNVSTLKNITPSNLWALNSSLAPTINDLRNAFAIQRLLEKDALGGNLYSELIYSHFGVTNPDSRVQLPEYLGGQRVNINMEQVVQTSESGVTPQGNVSGLSLTNFIGSDFVKSFTEHGYIIGLCCVRPMHSYQNGVNRLWSRSEKYDFYYPALANIGEQPVMFNELVAECKNLDMAIGYQEAWAEYRYKPSMVTSSMRTGLDNSLDIWHYADAFNVPNGDILMTCDEHFMYENTKLIDRTLSVSSELEPQFFADFYIKCDAVRPMPVYSIPGLVDHH